MFFDSKEKMIKHQTVNIVSIKSLPFDFKTESEDKVKERIMKESLISFSSTYSRKNKIVSSSNWLWSEKEQAFLFFLPEKNGGTSFTYYYPKTKEQKTILTVEDVL